MEAKDGAELRARIEAALAGDRVFQARRKISEAITLLDGPSAPAAPASASPSPNAPPASTQPRPAHRIVTVAAVAALVAGCDLLLYPGDLAEVVGAIDRAVAAGELSGPALQRSADRLGKSLASMDSVGAARLAPSARVNQQEAADQIADRLLERGLVRGTAPALDGLDLVVIDDDIGGWYAPGPSDIVRRTLGQRKTVERSGGSRIVVAFAEPRAAKGRAGFGPESLARLAALAPEAALVVVFGHPRLVAEIPAGPPVLLAWHRQPLMQRAVARWLHRAMGTP